MRYTTAKELFNIEFLRTLKKGDILYFEEHNETLKVLKNVPEENYINADSFWGDNTEKLKMRASYKYSDLLRKS